MAEARPPRVKPAKPHGCPLTPHNGGQWVKKVNGKLMYFGPWADREGAERRYYETRAAIAGGRPVERAVDSEREGAATVGDAVDMFLNAKQEAVNARELSQRTYDDYLAACRFVSDQLGRRRALSLLGPADFARLRAPLANRFGPIRLSNFLQRIRSLFKFAFDSELIDRPMRFGPAMKRPPMRLLRERRNAIGARMFTAEQIRSMLDAAKPTLKAMILLGINCGFGATDLSSLPTSAVDLSGGWITFPRPKTQQLRRVPLWPETVAALKVVAAARKSPKDAADAGVFFICRTRRRYVRLTKGGGVADGVAELFKDLAAELKLPARFYDLRRTHRTVSDSAGDEPAAAFIMGHAHESTDMGATYRQLIDDDRLRRVTNHVRTWLWPPAPAATKKKATSRKKAPAKTATPRKGTTKATKKRSAE